MEQKKVVVKSKFDNRIINVEQEIKGVKSRIDALNRRLKTLEPQTERDFLEKNKEKEIVLILLTGKEERGVRTDIGKYRVTITKDGKNYIYYKHALVGYCLA